MTDKSNLRDRSVPERTVNRFSYAIILTQGAKRISDANDPFAIAAPPIFLLLGFALENAFASYLIGNKHVSPGDYQSHDLKRAMIASKSHGLVLTREQAAYVEEQTPMHKDNAFRYPEKVDELSLPDVKRAVSLVNQIMVNIADSLQKIGIRILDIA